MTLISVVIPVYDRFDLLKRSLSALTLQTFRFFDVWICDDGSSEDISPIIDEYKSVLDINLVRTPHSGGPAAPRNRAIRCSHSQYIAFLDSDDYWLPDKLNESVRAIAKGANFVYHDLIVVEKGKIKRNVLGIPKLVHSYEMKADNLLVKTFSLGNSIPTSSVVIDRELLKQVNFFDERIKYISIEDAIAWLNVAKMRPTLKKIKKPLGFYEMGLQNNISSFTNIYKQLARTRSLYLYLITKHPEHRNYALFFRYKLALYLFRNGYKKRALIISSGVRVYSWKDLFAVREKLKLIVFAANLHARIALSKVKSSR